MSKIRCPICRKTFESDESPTKPFCSPRCRQIDLGRWLGEEYAMPANLEDESPEEPDVAED